MKLVTQRMRNWKTCWFGLAYSLGVQALLACAPTLPASVERVPQALVEPAALTISSLPPPEITPGISPMVIDPGKTVTFRAFSKGAEVYDWHLVGDGALTASNSPVAVYKAALEGGGVAVLTVTARSTAGVSPASSITVSVKGTASVPLEALGIPAGWMSGGDHPVTYLRLGPGQECRPDSPCTEFSYRAGGGWGGIYWWPVGCGPSGTAEAWEKFRTGSCAVNLPAVSGIGEVRRLTFWARGVRGGEVVEFKIGGSDILPIPGRSTGSVTLGPMWKEYEIDLTGVDLTRTAGLFVWIATDLANPKGAVFYLQGVRFEGLKL